MGITVDGTNGKFGLIVENTGIGVWDYRQNRVIYGLTWNGTPWTT